MFAHFNTKHITDKSAKHNQCNYDVNMDLPRIQSVSLRDIVIPGLRCSQDSYCYLYVSCINSQTNTLINKTDNSKVEYHWAIPLPQDKGAICKYVYATFADQKLEVVKNSKTPDKITVKLYGEDGNLLDLECDWGFTLYIEYKAKGLNI